MTPEKFLLNFYDVKQAGLYLPENASSGMPERLANKDLWDLFGKWYSAQTTFAATATYEKALYSDIERTFCYAFHSCADGSFILVTWNEYTTNRQGKIL